MSTPGPDASAENPRAALHTRRPMAESFGLDADGYDQARPAYPTALIGRIVADSPGTDVVDVGCGTGIAGRQFQQAGCTVLGVEPDGRMAELARRSGLPVDNATFEDWDPAGRMFDAVIAAQSWHWVDPQRGATKAAAVLRPTGQLAIFGHILEPPEPIARAFAEAFSRVVPESPFAQSSNRTPRSALDAYRAGYAKVAEAIDATADFHPATMGQYDWERTYTRDQWLRLLPTTGGLTRLDPQRLQEILTPVGAAIDELGGNFTKTFTTLIITAQRA